MKDQPEDAEIETSRLLKLGVLVRVPKKILNKVVGGKGRPARLARLLLLQSFGSGCSGGGSTSSSTAASQPASQQQQQ